MRIDGDDRSTEQLRWRVLELVALRRSALSKWSVTVDQLALAPRSGHLKVDVVHDARFRGARPFFVCGDQAFHGRLQESPLGIVEKATGSFGTRIPEQRGSLSCQRRSRNRD